MDNDPQIKASWDNNNDDPGYCAGDIKEQFMSKIDGEIDFDERYEVVGCIELSSSSSKYARFKFVYFLLSIAEQFGFYWIALYGTVKYGYEKWLNWYIISLACAGFISAFTSSIIGRLSDRYGRKYIILLSILIQSFPYIPMILAPQKIEYFLYCLPIIGFCGSISTLTGVMKAYVVDTLPKKFLISGFAKLVSIYSGAGIVSSIMIYTIIGNQIRNFFIQNDFIDFTTQLIMVTTVGLYIITFLMFAILVPESLSNEYKLKYKNVNPCHGVTYALRNSVIIYTSLFIFFCSFAQIGIFAVIQDIFLIDFDLANYTKIDLVSVGDTNTNASDTTNSTGSTGGFTATDALSDDLAIYGAFLFTLGCTLICTPCCIKCCCGKAITNMLCSMILMIFSFAMIIFLLLSNEWYAFIIALLCGIFFAMGEIGFAFLNGSIAKFINSKQYGIAYGLFHSIYSLSKACAPYLFFILFQMFITDPTDTNQMILGKAKPVVYIAIVFAIIGTLIGLLAIKKSMRKHKVVHENSKGAGAAMDFNEGIRHDYDRKQSQFDEIHGEYDNGPMNNDPNEIIEMQPPPARHHLSPSAISSVYVVGKAAPQYQSQPYAAPSVHGHQPQWTVLQHQQQQQQQQNPGQYNDIASSSYHAQPYSQPQQVQYVGNPQYQQQNPPYAGSDVV